MKKIIMVDDVNFHFMSTEMKLKGKYELTHAPSVARLFNILDTTIPDLILMDIKMPDEDGFAAIAQLKKHSVYRNIPIIILTGEKSRQSAIKGMKLGAADFVVKSVAPDKLIECIESQLNPREQTESKAVILAIDDSPSILESINMALKDIYQVYTLPRPEALMGVLERIIPDLFLVDYLMPKLTGFDLIPMIRSIPEHTDTPVVMLTTEGTIDNITVAKHYGIKEFLVKPIEQEILRDKLANQLSDYMLRRRIRLMDEE